MAKTRGPAPYYQQQHVKNRALRSQQQRRPTGWGPRPGNAQKGVRLKKNRITLPIKPLSRPPPCPPLPGRRKAEKPGFPPLGNRSIPGKHDQRTTTLMAISEAKGQSPQQHAPHKSRTSPTRTLSTQEPHTRLQNQNNMAHNSLQTIAVTH